MIKRAILTCGFLLSLLLSAGCATAQKNLAAAPGAVNLRDQEGAYPLGLHLEILKDPSRQLTIEQVSLPEMESRFAPSREETPSFGIIRSAIWVRVHFNDQSTNVPYWLIEVQFPSLEQVDLYLPQPQGYYELTRSGLLIPATSQKKTGQSLHS